MEIIRTIINDYGMTILYAIGTAIFGALGVFVKNQYTKIANNKEKVAVISTCVKAVEQLYTDLGGAEKLQKVKENTVNMLNAKGIDIAEIEMDMLIEACVLEFNLPFLESAKAERLAAVEHPPD